MSKKQLSFWKIGFRKILLVNWRKKFSSMTLISTVMVSSAGKN